MFKNKSFIGSSLGVCMFYIKDLQLKVVSNGHESSYRKIDVTVPQGSVPYLGLSFTMTLSF